MKITNYIITGLLAVLAAACGKPVVLDVDIKDFDKMAGKVAISAIIDDKAGQDTVFVRRLASVYQPAEAEGLNAVVTLADNRGNLTTLEPVAGKLGVYVTPAGFRPAIDDRMYTLTVNAAGQTFVATSPVGKAWGLATDSMTSAFKKESMMYKEGYYVKYYGSVQTVEKNYYLFKFYSNDTLLNRAANTRGDMISFADNSQLNGQIEGLELPNTYAPGAEAKLEVVGLTAEAWRYWSDVSKQIYNDGGMFSNPPANIKGNFSNGALGFFQVSQVFADSVIVR